MIWWTGLAPWKFQFPFPGSLTSTFLARAGRQLTRPQVPLPTEREAAKLPGVNIAAWKDPRVRTPQVHLTECIRRLVLEGQLPHKIVNLLFAITS